MPGSLPSRRGPFRLPADRVAEAGYLADIPISPITIEALKKAGYKCIRVSDVMASTASDQEIIEFAKKEEMVIITQDLDFSSLIALSGSTRPSVIQLRLENAAPAKISSRLLEILPEVQKALMDGAIISADERIVRTRHLPIDQEEGGKE